MPLVLACALLWHAAMNHGSGRPPVPHGFTLIELMVVAGIVLVLAALALPAYHVFRQQSYDSTALSDVVNAGHALEGLDGNDTFSVTVTGPGPIPGLPGPQVSNGTTLFLRRLQQGNGYSSLVQGSHRSGTLTFYFQDGALSAQ
ncbi:MAG: prepilin-type N-terminal cleavage/methylation domain-containing protein [Candidatus Binatia bacterium]